MARQNLSNLSDLTSLKGAEDRALVRAIVDDGCSSSLKKLAFKHMGLIVRALKKYKSTLEYVGVTEDEMREEILSMVWDAARDYRIDGPTQFSTWISNSTRWKCLRTITGRVRQSQRKGERDLVKEDADACLSYAHAAKVEGRLEAMLGHIENLRDPVAREILKLKYMGDEPMTLGAIAQQMGLSLNKTSNIHARSIRTLKCRISKDFC